MRVITSDNIDQISNMSFSSEITDIENPKIDSIKNKTFIEPPIEPPIESEDMGSEDIESDDMVGRNESIKIGEETTFEPDKLEDEIIIVNDPSAPDKDEEKYLPLMTNIEEENNNLEIEEKKTISV